MEQTAEQEPEPQPTAEDRDAFHAMFASMEADWRKAVRQSLAATVLEASRKFAIAQALTVAYWLATMAFIAFGAWVLGALYCNQQHMANATYLAWFAGVSLVSLFFTVAVWGPLGKAFGHD